MVIEGIGAFLKQLRTGANLTQEEIAESLGVSQTYLSQVERGMRNPSWKVVIRYADVIGVSVVSVLRGAGLLDNATETLEDEIAELVSQVSGFARLFALVKEIYRDFPEELDEIVGYVEWRLERVQRAISTD